MSIEYMNWVWDNSPLEGMEKFVHLGLADRADKNGYCYPGQGWIQRRTTASPSTITRATQKLEAAGLLRVGHHQGSARQNTYTLYMTPQCRRDDGVMVTGSAHDRLMVTGSTRRHDGDDAVMVTDPCRRGDGEYISNTSVKPSSNTRDGQEKREETVVKHHPGTYVDFIEASQARNRIVDDETGDRVRGDYEVVHPLTKEGARFCAEYAFAVFNRKVTPDIELAWYETLKRRDTDDVVSHVRSLLKRGAKQVPQEKFPPTPINVEGDILATIADCEEYDAHRTFVTEPIDV